MDTVVLIEGNLFDRQGQLEKIKQSMGDYELFLFDEEDNYEKVSHMATEISCFAQRRLFIVKALPKIKINAKKVTKDKSKLKTQERTKVLNNFKKLFPSIPAGNVLIFNGVGVSAESFSKEVRKYGQVFKFPQKINKIDGIKAAYRFFKKRKIELDEDLNRLIVDSLNIKGQDVDVDRLRLLLLKTYNYIYGKTKVKEKDIYAVCSSSREFVVWTLYNFLDAKKYCSSMGIVTDHLERAKYFRQEAILLIQGMAWRYELLLLAKSGTNNNMSSKEIKDKISNINKLESSGRSQRIKTTVKTKDGKPISKYSLKMINSIFETRFNKAKVSCYTYNELILIYYVLIKALLKIRSGCTDAEIRAIFQVIFLTICAEITKKNTVDGVLEHKKMLYGIWEDERNI